MKNPFFAQGDDGLWLGDENLGRGGQLITRLTVNKTALAVGHILERGRDRAPDDLTGFPVKDRRLSVDDNRRRHQDTG